ncbi:MAG: DUF4252 domain-containing protein [Cyclobacteriaceae bacterium]|nr:DUF4252 domain-containing protein [Cyclobacteriaceae bacterium]
MKRVALLAVLLSCFMQLKAQSKTTMALQSRFEGSLSLYFYKNTLRMLNQSDNKEFDAMIKDIEKLKFLMINKTPEKFSGNEYKKLLAEYRQESYEPIMTSRYQGRNLDVYLNDKKGSSPGTVVLVNDSTSLFVLDMIGTIDVSKAGSLFSMIDGSTDIGQKIKDFADGKKKKKKEEGEDDPDHN